MSSLKEKQTDQSENHSLLQNEEGIAVNIDLDVYMSDYSEKGYKLYATEKVSTAGYAERRKKIFEKTVKVKKKIQH